MNPCSPKYRDKSLMLLSKFLVPYYSYYLILPCSYALSFPYLLISLATLILQVKFSLPLPIRGNPNRYSLAPRSPLSSPYNRYPYVFHEIFLDFSLLLAPPRCTFSIFFWILDSLVILISYPIFSFRSNSTPILFLVQFFYLAIYSYFAALLRRANV